MAYNQPVHYALAGGRGLQSTDPMRVRFPDMFHPKNWEGNAYAEANSHPFNVNTDEKKERTFKTELTQIAEYPGNSKELVNTFWHNQWNLKNYYEALASSPIYKGMYEAIGRATIYAAQFMDNPFSKFMKDPVTQGNAVLSGIFKEIYSREWKIRGDAGYYPGEAGDPARHVSTLPLFSANIPELLTNVARLEFTREVALKVNAQTYAQYCQTPEMVGQIGAALMSVSNATYMNDMFAACKSYFCGPIRVRNDPVTSIVKQPLDVDEGSDENKSKIFPGADQGKDKYADVIAGTIKESKSPMIHVINGTAEGDPVWCNPRKLLKELHQTADVDFRFMSKKYNPAENNTKSNKVTCIMDRHLYYDTFCQEYADTYHESYIKPDMIDFQWVDNFPEMSSSIYNPDYKMIAMVVDDEVPAIYPQGDGLTVQTWFDPQEESMNFFTHYKYIFEFKPFFNRRYIYMHKDNIGLASA